MMTVHLSTHESSSVTYLAYIFDSLGGVCGEPGVQCYLQSVHYIVACAADLVKGNVGIVIINSS